MTSMICNYNIILTDIDLNFNDNLKGARKRLVAIYKAVGDHTSAIAHLNHYLE